MTACGSIMITETAMTEAQSPLSVQRGNWAWR